MRIGIDVRALMEGRTTGVQVYIINLLHAIFQLDKNNQYVLFANSYNEVDLPTFDYKNVSYVITKYPNKVFNFFQKFFLWPKVDKLIGGVDLFFSPHWRVVSIQQNVPLVVTFHDLSYEVVPEFFTLRQRFWHKLMNYRGAAKKAKEVIAVSESTKKDLIDIYKVREDKVSVIYSGVGVEAVTENRLNIPEKYFLFFATFEPRKNLDNLIEAYGQYFKDSSEHIPLVLAGSRGWKSKLEIPANLRSHISIFEDVDEGDKSQLYKNAFAFLFLSYYEGFGFPIIEAASFGVPVVSSFATSLSEVGKDFALFVNPFRPKQVSEAMLSLERDDKLYKSLSEKSDSAVKNFSWHETAYKTLELFKHVV